MHLTTKIRILRNKTVKGVVDTNFISFALYPGTAVLEDHRGKGLGSKSGPLPLFLWHLCFWATMNWATLLHQACPPHFSMEPGDHRMSQIPPRFPGAVGIGYHGKASSIKVQIQKGPKKETKTAQPERQESANTMEHWKGSGSSNLVLKLNKERRRQGNRHRRTVELWHCQVTKGFFWY